MVLTARFITAFTSACQPSLFWAISIQSTPPTSHFLKIHFNIILSPAPGSPKWSLSVSFPTKTLYTSILSHIRATCPAHLIRLDFIIRTVLDEQYRSLISSLRSFLHSSVTSSLLGPNILLNTLFSNTPRLRSSLNVNDQVSHPHTTTGKIIVLYILIFKFLESKLEDKIFWKADRYFSKTLRALSHLLWPLMSTPTSNKHKFKETPWRRTAGPVT